MVAADHLRLDGRTLTVSAGAPDASEAVRDRHSVRKFGVVASGAPALLSALFTGTLARAYLQIHPWIMWIIN